MVPVTGQAFAVDLGLRVPQLRAHDRLRAMEIDAFDVDDEHAARQLAVDREALHQFGIDRDRGAAIHAQGLAHAGNQKQQRDARIAHDVAEAVDAVVARPVGNRDGLIVEDAHKAARVALGRAVEPLRSAGRHRHERRRFDQFAVAAVDVVDFLDDGVRILFAVERLQLLHGRYQMIARAHVPFPLRCQQLVAVVPHHREIENSTRRDRRRKLDRSELLGVADAAAFGQHQVPVAYLRVEMRA